MCIRDSNITITAIKTKINCNRDELRQKLKDKLKNKRTGNLIHNQKKAHEESQRILKQSKKILQETNVKQDSKQANITNLFYRAKNVIKNKEEYSEFVKELNLISPERKFNSIFSKRLEM